MRNLTAAIALALAGFPAALHAQVVSPPPACPPAESLYTDKPMGIGRDLSVRQQRARYATYVVDSTYVVANQDQLRFGGSPAKSGALATLAPDDIESIQVIKGGAATRWNRCAGVMTISIVTKSKKWRPSTGREPAVSAPEPAPWPVATPRPTTP